MDQGQQRASQSKFNETLIFTISRREIFIAVMLYSYLLLIVEIPQIIKYWNSEIFMLIVTLTFLTIAEMFKADSDGSVGTYNYE